MTCPNCSDVEMIETVKKNHTCPECGYTEAR